MSGGKKISRFTNAADRAGDDAGSYVAAVLELLGDRDPIRVLEELPDALTETLAGMTSDELRAPEAPGKWSSVQLLAHLADAELVWAYRMRLVLAEADPILTGFDQDRWAEFLGYRDADPEEALESIRFQRRANLRLLRNLGPAELERCGRHDERGPETVRHMVRLYAGHDLVHRRQLERIRAAVRGGARARDENQRKGGQE